MTEQYDIHGKLVSTSKPEPKPVMSAEAEAMLKRPTPAFYEPLYDMLDRVGIHLDNFGLRRFADGLQAIRDDYPPEWIEPLEALIVERGVTNGETVLKYLSASSQRNIAPGDKPEAVKQIEAVREITDTMWARIQKVSQARDAVALNRATVHIAAVHEKGAAEFPPQMLLCTPDTHVERGCSLVEFGIYKNHTVSVPDDTKEWARKYVSERNVA
jgi:hypothetical protein